MIDTHCHLTFPDYGPEKMPGGVAGVLTRAEAAGVRGCVTISTTTRDCLLGLALAKRFENVWCTAGVHPLHADEGPHEWSALGIVVRDEKCVAWGELGLDNHYQEPAKATQHEVLGEQLDFIVRTHREGIVKPIVLHCREACDDLIPVLARTGLEPSRFVFHCFTSGIADMKKILDFGASVSFTGVVTYTNAKELREAVKLAPLDRIMLETDAPFLSPHPHRGVRPCEPWMASVTGREVAALKGISWEELDAKVAANVERFFGIKESNTSSAGAGIARSRHETSRDRAMKGRC